MFTGDYDEKYKKYLEDFRPASGQDKPKAKIVWLKEMLEEKDLVRQLRENDAKIARADADEIAANADAKIAGAPSFMEKAVEKMANAMVSGMEKTITTQSSIMPLKTVMDLGQNWLHR